MTRSDILPFVQHIEYEIDLAISVLQRIDSEFMRLRVDAIKREQK